MPSKVGTLFALYIGEPHEGGRHMQELIRLSLKQGIGAPPVAQVKAGEKVQRGQLVAAFDPDKLSVNLHSPVTGTVQEVTEDTIIVLPDPEQNFDAYVKLDTSLPAKQITRNAGIIGLGGAGFPSYVKMGTELNEEGYIICNAAECEPVLDHNMHQLKSDPEGLISAMEIAMASTGAGKGIIGMKFKHKEEIRLMTETLKRKGIKNIRVLPLRNIYPVGEERALIRDTINKLLDTTQLPVEANAVVFNVETLFAIRDAVQDGKPLIDKYMTVAGTGSLAEGEARVIQRPIGSSIDVIIEEFGGVREGNGGEILLGGPWTGRRGSHGEYTSKNLGGIILTDGFESLEGEKIGIIQCACGPAKPRLEQIAESMGAEVISFNQCNNLVENRGAFKCKDPGNCPGQAEKVLEHKKAGAGHVLIGHCSDCTNTVMGSAPRLNMGIHHATDHVLRTMGKNPIRNYSEDAL